MKKRELNELKNESAEKLMARVAELKAEIVRVQMPSLGKTETNLKKAKAMRKTVAQMLGLITQNKQTK